jgi:hypothetical protein
MTRVPFDAFNQPGERWAADRLPGRTQTGRHLAANCRLPLRPRIRTCAGAGATAKSARAIAAISP